ncbi:hypothetical protein [Bradyrhizobium sp. ISRA464]|uniref:hypothetical protein n=1 Tax=Bradyrhizobium sp. ISRA464 TaxID=2866200 RepID=UPI00247A4526|nr:hypothetical protein [Bradyrhizobium sp. ISRA464]WGS29915.1 hypothetical protein MTX19_13170 [Bradyrhizobium sp. ISRA464]
MANYEIVRLKRSRDASNGVADLHQRRKHWVNQNDQAWSTGKECARNVVAVNQKLNEVE